MFTVTKNDYICTRKQFKLKKMNTLQQELPKRFTDAVSKLYKAFHENRLNAMDPCACAVGNICDNSNKWMNYFSFGYIKNRNSGKDISKFGYSAKQLSEIEIRFLEHCSLKEYQSGKFIPVIFIQDYENKETQFKGVCAVIEYLCELDNIPNIMHFQSLFETENDKPKKQLQFR